MVERCVLQGDPPCGEWATHRVTMRGPGGTESLRVCWSHARRLVADSGAMATTLPPDDTCQYADTGNGPCGGPTNGLYCWDHKDLRHGGVQ